jgi:hypothetical protein
MKTLTAAVAGLMCLAAPAWGQSKSCDEIKAEIEQKITNNGVAQFSLTIVDKDAPEDGKVVGTCGGGTKKIIYKRG